MVTKSKTGQVVLNIVFIILAVWAVAPFLLLISSSLSSEAALAKYGYGFWPREFSLNAYTYLFKSSMKIAKGYGITLIVTLVGTTLSVLITTLFAYPLSRKELPFRYGFSFFVFFTMLFNGGLVPSYMMWTQTFHIKNTIWALIMPSLLLNAFYVIMMRSFFTSSIPDALIEAARIDGSKEWNTFNKIILPIMKPAVATQAIFQFIAQWNNLFTPTILLTTDSKKTLPMFVQLLSSNQFRTDYGVVYVGLFVTIIPLVVVYLVLSKYIVAGVALGGVKG